MAPGGDLFGVVVDPDRPRFGYVFTVEAKNTREAGTLLVRFADERQATFHVNGTGAEPSPPDILLFHLGQEERLARLRATLPNLRSWLTQHKRIVTQIGLDVRVRRVAETVMNEELIAVALGMGKILPPPAPRKERLSASVTIASAPSAELAPGAVALSAEPVPLPARESAEPVPVTGAANP